MGLDTAFSIATGGLVNTSRQLDVVSQNVSNASTSGYTREVGTQTSLSSGDLPMGVRTGITQRAVDTMLQSEARQQNAAVAALDVRSQALSSIDTAHGTVGDGNDLASLTGSLKDAFSSLAASTDSASTQASVVSAANTLVNGIHRVADAISTQRQSAQDSLVQEVGQLNDALSSVGTLSRKISSEKAAGRGTAALEDQRDTALDTIATLTGAHFNQQNDGSVQVILPSGTTLPTDGTAVTLSDGQVGAQTAAPAISLNGADITDQFTTGQIGANVSLRDSELPTFQAELDEFSHNMADRFSAAGLDLFTDGTNAVAAASATPPVQADYLGLSSRIAVNPAVSADSSLVQQGTDGVTRASSDQTIINAVLDQAFGPQSATTAAAPSAQYLGVSGKLSLPFSSPPTLSSFATDVVSSQTGTSSAASSDLTNAQAIQKTLNTKVSSVSGVSVDTEMSAMISLQNSYAANARMITTIKDLWNVLQQMGS